MVVSIFCICVFMAKWQEGESWLRHTHNTTYGTGTGNAYNDDDDVKWVANKLSHTDSNFQTNHK